MNGQLYVVSAFALSGFFVVNNVIAKDPEFAEWKSGNSWYAPPGGFTTGKVKFETGVHDVAAVTLPANAPSIVSDYASSTTALGKSRPKALRPHSGIDITATKGYPVIAASDGKVILSDTYNSAGKTVVIEHGTLPDGKRLLTAYIHLDTRLVKPGQRVERGQYIGKIGRTGKAWGKHDHLHWGVDLLPPGEADKAFYKYHVNPHNFWVDGAGKAACFTNKREYPDKMRFTYPVPCLEGALDRATTDRN